MPTTVIIVVVLALGALGAYVCACASGNGTSGYRNGR